VWVIPVNFKKYRDLENHAVAKVFAIDQQSSSRKGYPAQFIMINSAHEFYAGSKVWNWSQRRWIMMHEISHALGFLHADSTDGIKLAGLPNKCNSGNSKSVMRCCIKKSDPYFGMTECDVRAYWKVYPQ